MEKYYIIDSHGSSVFMLPYPKDFCVHCLVLLLDARPQEAFSLLSADFELQLRRKQANIPKSDLLDIKPATATARSLKLRSDVVSAWLV